MDKNDKDFIVEKIRTQYTEKKDVQLEQLKALDRKATRPAKVFAYIFGSIGAVVMGSGMSLIMTDIGAMLGITEVMLPGIVTGTIGLLMACVTYPIYKKILSSRKKKYAGKILELSEEMMKG